MGQSSWGRSIYYWLIDMSEEDKKEEKKEKPKKEFDSGEVDKKKYDDYFGTPPV